MGYPPWVRLHVWCIRGARRRVGRAGPLGLRVRRAVRWTPAGAGRRASLGEPTYAAWAAGQAMPLEQAVAGALEDPPAEAWPPTELSV